MVIAPFLKGDFGAQRSLVTCAESHSKESAPDSRACLCSQPLYRGKNPAIDKMAEVCPLQGSVIGWLAADDPQTSVSSTRNLHLQKVLVVLYTVLFVSREMFLSVALPFLFPT